MVHVYRLALVARFFHPKYRDLILNLTTEQFQSSIQSVTTPMSGGREIPPIRSKLFVEHEAGLISDFNIYKQCLTFNTDDLHDEQHTFSQFWTRAESLPALLPFCYCAKVLMSLPTSSAHVERLFSLINNYYTPLQSTTLPDVMNATLLIHRNPKPSGEPIAFSRRNIQCRRAAQQLHAME